MKRIDLLKSLGFTKNNKALTLINDHGEIKLHLKKEKIIKVTINAEYSVKDLCELKSILAILPEKHIPLRMDQVAYYYNRPVVLERGRAKQNKILERVTVKYAWFTDGTFEALKGYGKDWMMYRAV